ncbi:MAG: hypothetical protein EOS73_32120 [Mesorhizobium sp.]|uniref:hypothetical protein n=1 Tax=Mesorhizobium sp. M7A.F.Ca.ET.027.02.1.1 TaxID=2496655 RepID=UPI000FD49752|nr:hypothetical protein [Mesorhizobium sp. M7A.F.Ca.ET.027.02.1.1]RVD15417.1 hypothetical protein EN749_16065 [Mesorhizobium sp. M7A.F.Ca.ET.027.02.1.1]RWC98078.1 MAG: hypothetical protein EOS73_32120 [Mesorhizobium sp.]
MSNNDEIRTVPRLITDEELRRIKTLTSQAIKAVGGGDAFEPSTRVKQAALSNYGNNAVPDKFIPLDVAIELDRAAQAPLLLGGAARMLGYRLEPIDAPPATRVTMGDAQSVAKESSDVVNMLLALLASDKPLDAADRQALMKEITEAMGPLYKLVTKLGAA